MRKNQPFVEVLNLEKEYKEYIKLCKSSSRKVLKNKPCKRNNRQKFDNTKNAAKQGNAEERPDADCGIKR